MSSRLFKFNITYYIFGSAFALPYTLPKTSKSIFKVYNDKPPFHIWFYGILSGIFLWPITISLGITDKLDSTVRLTKLKD